MSNICSDMDHILDRMVSIMELHVPLKAKLKSEDSEKVITIDTPVDDEFVFPKDLKIWISNMLSLCDAYKNNTIFKYHGCEIIDGDTISLNARRGAFIQFIHGIQRNGNIYPSYAMYRLVSTDPFYYRRIYSISNARTLIEEFLNGLI